MLRYFHDFCQKHQLRYYLAYGTLLGAIRHRGFIPWDDDIDLMMPRPDYLRFIKLFDRQDHGSLKVVSIYNNPDYFAVLGKIIDTRTTLVQDYGRVEKVELGVYLDLFPLDGIPEDDAVAAKLIKRVRRWSFFCRLAIRKFSVNNPNPFKRVIMTVLSVPFRIIGPLFFISKLEELGMRNKYDECTRVACTTSREILAQGIERRHLEENILVDFEGGKYPAPSSWEDYLSAHYGDYMTPPPENQRQPHLHTVFWKS
ncbi:MAG: phosphorylcholine transferase LicD [Synoicihabitans sp.]